MRITYEGEPGFGVTAKDLILGHDRPDQRRGRGRPRDRVRRRADRGALDRGPHDDLQHVDRGRRARAGMIAPDDVDLLLPRGPPRRRRRTSTPPSSAGARCRPTRARRSTPRSPSTPPRSVPQVTWGTNPGQVVPVTGRVPDPADARRPGRPRGGRARARLHGARAGHGDRGHRRSTACSSAPARTRASRTCARPPRWSRGRQVAATVRAMVVPGSHAGEGAGRAGGPRRGLQARPGSSGARPAARCASG